MDPNRFAMPDGLSDIFKPWLFPSVPDHGFQKHGQRTHPQSTLSIKRRIDHQFFPGLGMPGYAKNLVLTALEVTVFPRLQFTAL